MYNDGLLKFSANITLFSDIGLRKCGKNIIDYIGHRSEVPLPGERNKKSRLYPERYWRDFYVLTR